MGEVFFGAPIKQREYKMGTPRAKAIIAIVNDLHKAGIYPGAIRVMRLLGKTGECKGMNGRDNYVRKRRMRELKIELAEVQ